MRLGERSGNDPLPAFPLPPIFPYLPIPIVLSKNLPGLGHFPADIKASNALGLTGGAG